jgi:hypothetical protein
VDHRGRRALVGFELRSKLRPANTEVCAGTARLDDRDTDFERRDKTKGVVTLTSMKSLGMGIGFLAC